MELKIIKQKLDKEGYKSLLRKENETVIGEHIIAGINDEQLNFKLGTVFRIWIVNNKIMLDNMSQVLENIFFDSEDSLIEYVKENFPIEK
jgi:predicted DNA-binding ArsR family transcriptional regulator